MTEQEHMQPVTTRNKWTYCPECGGVQTYERDEMHMQCKECGQEWWTDLDYTDVVLKHLSSRANFENENKRLREALRTVLASLVAATSLLERGGKKAAASDKMFALMLSDYVKAADMGRAALKGEAQ